MTALITPTKARLAAEHLFELAAGKNPLDTGHGICWSLLSEVGLSPDDNRILLDMSREWEHHSGSAFYPVPGSSYAYAEAQKYRVLWQGRQGELRRDLCLYLAERLKAMLDDDPS